MDYAFLFDATGAPLHAEGRRWPVTQGRAGDGGVGTVVNRMT